MTSRGEPAGVTLEARGFKQYIARLDEIDRKQREVFEREFKGAGKSFAQVQTAARNYERQLKSLEQQYNRAVAQEQKLANAQAKTANTTGLLNTAFKQISLAVVAQQAAEYIVESAKLAASFDAQVVGLNNLAATYGVAGNDIRNAIREASRGTLSETQILLAANKSLQLEVAQTPEEFARVTKNALILGKTLGLDATQSIDEFTTALGRKTIRILDNFGIKMDQVNRQIAVLGQERFGKAFEDLSAAERDLLFIEASLRVADERVEAIGTSAFDAAGSFDRINAEAENLKIVFGTAILPLAIQFGDALADALGTAQQAIAIIAAGATGVGSIIKDITPAASVGDLFEQFQAGQITFAEFLFGTNEPLEDKTWKQILDDAALAAEETFKDIARAQGVAFPEDQIDESTKAVEENTDALEDNEDQIKALQAAVRQAEQLELSFARAAEDAARKQARQVAKLNRDQFKERQKFLNDQAKEFDDFNADQAEAVAEAEEDLAKEREQANKERIREQDKLFRELRQAQDRFDLDRIQSERRFNLDERRLRAEGDILGLQQLREDFALQEQEAAENFDLQQRHQGEDAKDQEQQQDEQRQERVQAAEQELRDLQDSFAEKQAEFLRGQDEQFQALLETQAEQRLASQQSFAEQEEDRRISQQRQIEDLGRSLAEQESITAEGAAAIAQQLEEAFGVEGIADQIMTGFTARQESAFQKLFESIAEGAKTAMEQLEALDVPVRDFGRPLIQTAGGRELPGFQHGGDFTVGGTGGADSQLVAFRATPGEKVTVTPQQQTFRMPIAAPGQLNVSFGGRSQIDVTGLEGANQETVDRAVEQMIEIQDIAIRRILRRHGVN